MNRRHLNLVINACGNTSLQCYLWTIVFYGVHSEAIKAEITN